MTIEEKRIREELGAAADAMQDITAKADKENRNLTKAEKKEHERLYEQVQNLKKELEAELALQGNFDNSTAISVNNMFDGPQQGKRSEVWKDKAGSEIKVYNKNQSLADTTPDVGIGEIAEGMLTGAKSDRVKNALSEGTDSAGGFTVPSATLDDFFDKLRSKARVVQAGARTIQLDTDETTIARVSGDPSIIWHTENADESANYSDVTFEGAIFKPKTLMILVKASRELIADSVNASELLEDVFAGTVAAGVDAGILFGSNTGGEMKGLTSFAIAEHDMGTNGAALTNYDPLVTVFRKMLDNDATAPTAYIMAPREWETLATLKDTNNRYLDRPQALDGIPFYDSTNIPTNESHGTAIDASRIITGNWEDLVIGLRSEMRIELMREKFADSYQFGFMVHMRVDALPARTESFGQVTGIIP